MTGKAVRHMSVIGGEPMRCGYCGEFARELYSFNPSGMPDICPACYALAADGAPPAATLREMQHPPREDCQAEGWHLCAPREAALAAALAPKEKPLEGDLPTEHLNRCKLRDNLLYADIFNEDGSHRATWRCHKREGHDGPCSSHNDCGVMNGGVVCGLVPGHTGPHQWATEIRAAALAPHPEPHEPDVVPLDDPSVPASLVPIPNTITIDMPWVYLSLGSQVDGRRAIYFTPLDSTEAYQVGTVAGDAAYVEEVSVAFQHYNDAMNAERRGTNEEEYR